MTLAETSVALVTDRDLSGTGKGNVQRILALGRVLAAGGAQVTAISPLPQGPAPRWPGVRQRHLDAPRFRGGHPSRFDPAPFARALVRQQPAPQVAIAAYAWMAPALSALPETTIRLVDLHDILHERTRRFAAAGLDPWVVCTADEETRLLAQASGLIAISDEDRKLAEQRLLAPPALAATIPFSMAHDVDPQPSSGARLLFVGSDHAGNLGIRQFVERVLPRVRAAEPAARLSIVGGICSALTPADGLELIPFAPNLAAAYARAALVVAPVVCGTGVKIKTLDALAHGRAAVVLPEAVAGMAHCDPAPWALCFDWAEMAERIIDLLRDTGQRHALERRGLAFVRRHHADGSALDAFCDLMGALSAGR